MWLTQKVTSYNYYNNTLANDYCYNEQLASRWRISAPSC